MTMRTNLVRTALGGAFYLFGAGCALTNKSAPVEFRYFTTEAVATTSRPNQEPSGIAGKHLEVRLGRINASSYLRDKIAYRDEGYELGYYEELRWTEKPEAYLRRAVARVLFEDRGLKELVNAPGATLDVDLAAFEELRSPRHVARVEVTYSLRDEQSVRIQRTITAEHAIPQVKSDALPDAIAAAMSSALRDAVTTIADGTVTALSHEDPRTH